jgi:uncharacterized protein (DUF302 family)
LREASAPSWSPHFSSALPIRHWPQNRSMSGGATLNIIRLHKIGHPIACFGIYKALEGNGFKVVYEIDMQENLTKFSAKNAVKDFNLNKLEGIKSMVFCNAPLAVKISNADPAMLALCPLHLTLTQKLGRVTILFARPGFIAKVGRNNASRLSNQC